MNGHILTNWLLNSIWLKYGEESGDMTSLAWVNVQLIPKDWEGSLIWSLPGIYVWQPLQVFNYNVVNLEFIVSFDKVSL
jgi:hypothetical protein